MASTTISSTIPHSPATTGIGRDKATMQPQDSTQINGASFLDVLKAQGTEALAASKAADAAMTPQGLQQTTQLERAQVMNEATLALEEFKRALEATKSSLDHILNTPL